jgi:hypothetical protein
MQHKIVFYVWAPYRSISGKFFQRYLSVADGVDNILLGAVHKQALNSKLVLEVCLPALRQFDSQHLLLPSDWNITLDEMWFNTYQQDINWILLLSQAEIPPASQKNCDTEVNPWHMKSFLLLKLYKLVKPRRKLQPCWPKSVSWFTGPKINSTKRERIQCTKKLYTCLLLGESQEVKKHLEPGTSDSRL